jgi:Bacterial Ig-like domain (group 2)
VTASGTFTVTGGASEAFTAITVGPSGLSLSASGQTGQLVALGTSGSNGLNTDVTNSSLVSWTSSIPSIATVGTSGTGIPGLVTGVSAGTTVITATLTNKDTTVLTASATVTVTLTTAPEPLLSLTIIPTTVSVGNLLDTGQFLAIGTFSTPPFVQDLTNSPNLTWISSDPHNFPINTTGATGAQAGIITAYAPGSVVVIAEAKNPSDGTIATATATFNCPLVLPNPPLTPGSCYPGSESPSLLATLTVFNAGLNTTQWLITASSATGTADVIHCGPGSSGAGFGAPVCLATYPIGTTVTLTAPAGAGKFGGWSANCTNTAPVTEAGPNSCTVVLSTNDSVGGIFN